jgi:hypothetical protein
MKNLFLLMIMFALALAAVPAYAAEATQVWRCEMDDDATEQQVKAMAQDWLKAAKSLPGGQRIKATVYFPVAADYTDEIDILFVVTVPSFEEWGKFWDNYGGSAAAQVEKRNQSLVVCPDSSVWESVNVQ